MADWTCPECGRTFGRRGQGHGCSPGLSVEEYFASGPPFERPVFEVVRAHLEGLGPLIVEPVQVGVFFKRGRTFAELRPRQKWVALSFSLHRAERHPRIKRKVEPYGNRFFHVANLVEPEDLDDRLRHWLTESYLDADAGR